MAARPTVGIALGGGFARGLAHIGVLQVLEEENIPVDYIAGISAGSVVAAAYASGTPLKDVARFASSMRFGDVARWTFCKMGFCCTNGMSRLLGRLVAKSRFEEMRIPLAVAATDLQTGDPVIFSGEGDVSLAIRASCAFPGIFRPVEWGDRYLTDGAISMEVPAALVRNMGAEKVIAVSIPRDSGEIAPANLLDVLGRSLQILQMRTEDSWRKSADLVIVPDVGHWPWHDFRNSDRMIAAGATAARRALPAIRALLERKPSRLISFPPAA